MLRSIVEFGPVSSDCRDPSLMEYSNFTLGPKKIVEIRPLSNDAVNACIFFRLIFLTLINYVANQG